MTCKYAWMTEIECSGPVLDMGMPLFPMSANQLAFLKCNDIGVIKRGEHHHLPVKARIMPASRPQALASSTSANNSGIR